MTPSLLSTLQPPLMSSLTSSLASDTDLSSALCLTPSLASFRIQQRTVKDLCLMSGEQEAAALGTSGSSVRLPDHIQELHHLLIDDEN